MSGRDIVDGATPKKWILNARYVPDKEPDGRVYVSLAYKLFKNLKIGVDYRPLSNDVGYLANWRVLSETKRRPALILGTATDTFTVAGNDTASQSVFATLSKRVGSLGGVDISPYAGGVYIVELEEFRPVGGLHLRYDEFSSMFMYSGTDPHFVLSWNYASGHSVSFILWGFEQPGVSYTWRF